MQYMTNSVENGSKISDVHYFGSSLEFDLNDQNSNYSVWNEITSIKMFLRVKNFNPYKFFRQKTQQLATWTLQSMVQKDIKESSARLSMISSLSRKTLTHCVTKDSRKKNSAQSKKQMILFMPCI